MPTPTTGSSTTLVAFSDDPVIDALILSSPSNIEMAEKWGGALGTGATVTYSFPDLDSTWSTDADSGYGAAGGSGEPWDLAYRGLDATQKNAVRVAIQAWGSVANVNPVETDDDADEVGDIRIAFTSGGTMDSHTYAYAYTPQGANAQAADIWLNPQPPNAEEANDFSIGASGYSTVIHELGHALGLDHTFSIPEFPDEFDWFKYSVMSYSDAPGHHDQATAALYPTTPMLLDIQALQYLYGPNMAYRTGNDIYVFDQGVYYYQTIWDAGGIDTIRYNAATDGARIDLRSGHYSQLGRSILLSDGVTQQPDTVAIAFGVTVENAIGGNGDDEIIGNSADNVLDGGSGKDKLTGNSGTDTLNGGPGNDIMDGGSGNDTYVRSSAGDVMTELANHGNDTVQSAIGYTLRVNFENLTLTGSSKIDGAGNSAANVLTGNSNDNTLSGAGGNDALSGGGGTDNLEGGSGNDVLNGGSGNDKMAGGSGNDTYVRGSSGDAVSEFANQGTDLVRSAVSYSLGANLENLLLTGSSAINGTGNNGNNVLTGSSKANTLRGGLGKDTLNGQDGNDTLFGGTGNDILDGGAGPDILRGGNGADRFHIDAAAHSSVAHPDTVTDFAPSQKDRIDLGAIDADELLEGDQAFDFIGSEAFTAAGQLRFDAATHLLLGSTDADYDAEFSIKLTGIDQIATDHFIL